MGTRRVPQLVALVIAIAQAALGLPTIALSIAVILLAISLAL